ncbi:MAG: hypothetical protein AAF721_03410 [Myxococcota bacterium]
MKRSTTVGVLFVLSVACGDGDGSVFDSAVAGSTGPGTGADAADGNSAEDTTGGADETTADDQGAGPKLDIMMAVDLDPFDPPEPTCRVVDDMDGVGECGTQAPSNSFDPEVQWSWDGGASIVTPLVGNLTDDDGNGVIDLCDTPDVLVVTQGLSGSIHVLDGATGAEHFSIDNLVNSEITPAIGDIDGDGEAEIISAAGPLFAPLSFVAFETDGTPMWSTEAIWAQEQGGAVAIADMDNDGSPEIIGDGHIVSADGTVLFSAPAQTGWPPLFLNTASIAADLDDDGDLELILGQAAYQHTGEVVWNNPDVLPGYPQVANLDNDDDPEIIVNNDGGITILEHDGTVKNLNMRPTGEPAGLGAWFRPSTVHDFDGDNVSEFAVSSAASYSVFDPNLIVAWSVPVDDGSGWAAGTAFDFLGDGIAEAMYADETTLFVYGDQGATELQVPRSSRTLIEYPVVADVDNDGSAEIVIVSGQGYDDMQTSPTVQVIRDSEDRWIQARRIWNQHTYHVTNVREDGTIPMVEPKSWQLLNTYRTNAQIENGSVCKPPPEG